MLFQLIPQDECRHGLVWLGTVWYRLVRLSAAWYGLVEGFALKLVEPNAVNVVQLVFFCFDDNEPLKLALAKLIAINSPNLVWALKKSEAVSAMPDSLADS